MDAKVDFIISYLLILFAQGLKWAAVKRKSHLFNAININMCCLPQGKSRGIEAAREKMFSGEKINFTEVLIDTCLLQLDSRHLCCWGDTVDKTFTPCYIITPVHTVKWVTVTVRG